MKTRRLLFGLLAAAVMIGVLFNFVEFDVLAERLVGVALLPLIAALALRLLAIYVKAQRWSRAIEAGLGVRPCKGVFAATVIGVAGNIILPLRLGDAARLAFVSKRNDMPWGLSLSSAGACHVLDLLILTSCALVAATISVRLDIVDADALVLCLLGLVGIVAVLVFVSKFAKAATAPSECSGASLSAKDWDRIKAQGRGLISGLAGLRRAKSLWSLIAHSLVIWATEFAAMTLAMDAFHIPHTWVLAILLVCALNFSYAIPVTPGNLGTHQVTTVVVLGTFGIAPAHALAFSIGTQGLIHLSVLLLAALILWYEGVGLQGLQPGRGEPST